MGAITLGGCASQEAPPPKAEPPKELPKLLEQKTALTQQWGAVDETIRSRCEMSDGDCMMEVREQRHELLSIHTYPACDTEHGDKKEQCEENLAAKQGMGKEIASYYQFHNRCMTQMVACTARLEAQAEEKMRVARAETRYGQIKAIGASESALVESLTAKEGVAYLRSTLPPQEEGACKEMPEVASCFAATKESDKAIKSELMKEDGEFDESQTASMYQDARNAEAQCYDPEFSCLIDHTRKYGGSPETQRTLKANIEIIKQRERLSLRVAPAAAEQCKAAAVAKHQQSVISAYLTYTKQPVLFFRRKLHGAFLKLHEDQVACLRGTPSAAPATPAAPPAPKPRKAPAKPAPQEPEKPDAPALQAKR